ncbi:hypothetical protein I203_105104 [Kwoniella mangroviensis CBS 8507]|uniref:uncharacterized protein n=1 Tax=Kwoniella mangroviensis CBS 8507 TaxID=1296122 RepID=UPI00080CD1A8|nr:uncharacterized protein I203_08430 [Kwoniella mangroviensis CBS 8507]OCF62506.1 hypothetical protein I203_08430 [Kwoniella mangroviensis CBS 8507]
MRELIDERNLLSYKRDEAVSDSRGFTSPENGREVMAASISPLFSSESQIIRNSQGQTEYHNHSSMYRLPLKAAKSKSRDSVLPDSFPQDAESRRKLLENAATQRGIEPAILYIYTLGLPEAPQELYTYLLDSFWTWIYPMFSMVYRPAFVRGMLEVNNPYFNSFQFHAILAHSTRHCREQQAMADHQPLVQYFEAKAKTLLDEELEKGSSVATAQGLLLLSALENTKGRISQGWMYAGMAFRMVQDLGCQFDVGPDEHHTEVDLEARRRLWWSAYLWDKMISVYLGRTPMLQDTISAAPQVILDDSTEHDIWTPLGMPGCQVDPRPSHAVSCFIMACSTSVVLTRVLLRYYCGTSEGGLGMGVEDKRLLHDAVGLLEKIPMHLRVNANDIVPTHLSHLACFIHATIILAHRPHYAAKPDKDHAVARRCMDSAVKILDVVRTERIAYGMPRFTIVAWTLWVAASVFLLDLAVHKQMAIFIPADTVKTLREIQSILLEMAGGQPSLHRSVEVLNDQLGELAVESTSDSATDGSRPPQFDDTAPGDFILNDIFLNGFLSQAG